MTYRTMSERSYHGPTSHIPSPGLYPDPNHRGVCVCGGGGGGGGRRYGGHFGFFLYNHICDYFLQPKKTKQKKHENNSLKFKKNNLNI